MTTLGAAAAFSYEDHTRTRMVFYWDFLQTIQLNPMDGWWRRGLEGEFVAHHPQIPTHDGVVGAALNVLANIHETYALNPKEAVGRCEKLFREHERDVIGVCALGLQATIYDVTNDEASCRHTYERALGLLLKLDPEALHESHCRLGYILGTLTANLYGAQPRARRLWGRLAEANPDNPQPRRVLQLFDAFGEYDPAPLEMYFRAQRARRRATRERLYEEALARYPHHAMAPFLLMERAEAALEVAEVKDARPWYRRMLAEYPTATFPCDIPGEPGWPMAPYAHYVLGLLEFPEQRDVGMGHLQDAWRWVATSKSTDAYAGGSGIAILWLSQGIAASQWAALYMTLDHPWAWAHRGYNPVLLDGWAEHFRDAKKAREMAGRMQETADIPMQRLGWGSATTRRVAMLANAEALPDEIIDALKLRDLGRATELSQDLLKAAPTAETPEDADRGGRLRAEAEAGANRVAILAKGPDWRTAIASQDGRPVVSTGVVEIQPPNAGSLFLFPSWSPDGQWLAVWEVVVDTPIVSAEYGGWYDFYLDFFSGPPNWSTRFHMKPPYFFLGARNFVRVMPSDGSSPGIRLYQGCLPAWGPDGKMLVFYDLRGVWTADLATLSQKLQVASEKETSVWLVSSARQPCSRDGRYVLFGRTGDEWSDTGILDTSTKHWIASGADEISWASSGETFAAVTWEHDYGEATPRIFFGTARSSHKRTILEGKDLSDPCYLQDGRVRFLDRVREKDRGADLLKIKEYGPHSSTFRVVLSTSGESVAYARWSPGGDILAFVRNGDIFLYLLATKQIRGITHGSNIDGKIHPALEWSPDGARIAWANRGRVYTTPVPADEGK